MANPPADRPSAPQTSPAAALTQLGHRVAPTQPKHLLALLLTSTLGAAAPWTIYETEFEPPDFLADYTLDGQGDWLVPWWASPADEANTSQVVTNYFPGLGQQALLGWTAPTNSQLISVSTYRPLYVDPVAQGTPLVAFSVTMAIFDDTDLDPNSFRWVVYNRDETDNRLFALDFDIGTGAIAYLLDDDPTAHDTGFSFELDGFYELTLLMNLEDNVWSAELKGLRSELIVNAVPLTQSGRSLTLGDIDAAWVLGPDSDQFGDSYLVFDNFRVVADTGLPLPARIEILSFLADGAPLLQISGEPNRTYALDASWDLETWQAIATNTPSDGVSIVLDHEAAAFPTQFYRARAVWP